MKSVEVRLTMAMEIYLNQLLENGLHGFTLAEACERLICQSLEPSCGVKQKMLNPDAWTHIGAIAQAAAVVFGVSHEAIMSDKRDAEIADARHAAIYAVMQTRRYTTVKIARYFKRDHSSVLHACNKIRDQMKHDAPLKNRVEQLLACA
jgi:hypothetical protein